MTKNISNKVNIPVKVAEQIKNLDKTIFVKSFFIDTPELSGRKLKPILREKHDIHVYDPSQKDKEPEKITIL